MAMVVRANRQEDGIGGHISTFASAATLYEVGFNHFFRGRGESDIDGDLVFFQGHASPGIYARAFLEGRIGVTQLENFRRELAEGGGLSSYPHPWLMPDFWEVPDGVDGPRPDHGHLPGALHPLSRGSRPRQDEPPQGVGFSATARPTSPNRSAPSRSPSREKLDNLIFVINCNLQRLDGPVRGNGKIIQELEAIFRGAGWNVIKVIWGRDWDPLLARDHDGLLVAPDGRDRRRRSTRSTRSSLARTSASTSSAPTRACSTW